MNIKPSDLLRTVADHIATLRIKLSGNRAFIPGGVNGPYFDIETPIRNTAHWLITYSILYKLDGEERYRVLAKQLLNFLLQPGEYQKNDIFIQRQKAGRDWTNGVIGQGWVVEALAIAGRLLDHDDSKRRSRESAVALPFDAKIGAWKRPQLAGIKQQIDYTLNHQLWFAASKAEVFSDQYLDDVSDFLTVLDKGGFRIREDGRICHLLYSSSLKGLLLQTRYKLLEKRSTVAVEEKEIGYHLYNLFPLARLKVNYFNHSFFQNKRLKKALDYSISAEFKDKLLNNKFSYAYNSPAFEYPLIFYSFSDYFENLYSSNAAERLMNELKVQFDHQVEATYDQNTRLFSNMNQDPITLTARIYELALCFAYQKGLT